MRAGELLVKLWRAGAINGVTWMDIFYLHMSCLVIILALVAPETLEQDWDRDPEANPPAPPPLGKMRRHVQRYTVQEMREMVRLLCRVMANVEVCGTNARFAKVSLELAKTTGIIQPDDPSFQSSPLPNARMMSESQGTGTEDLSPGTGSGSGLRGSGAGIGGVDVGVGDRRGGLTSPGYFQTTFQQQQQQPQPQDPYYPLAGSSSGAGVEYPMWATRQSSSSSFPTAQNPPTGGLGSSGVSMNFPDLPVNTGQSQVQGFTNAPTAMAMSMAVDEAAAAAVTTTIAGQNTAGGNPVQWDMVMLSSQWDDNVMDMDLTWDWQAPPPPMNPYQDPPGDQGNQ